MCGSQRGKNRYCRREVLETFTLEMSGRNCNSAIPQYRRCASCPVRGTSGPNSGCFGASGNFACQESSSLVERYLPNRVEYFIGQIDGSMGCGIRGCAIRAPG